MLGPISRIILRYAIGGAVAAQLISNGFADQLLRDPDLVVVLESILSVSVPIVLGALTEGIYFLAKKFNWKT